LLATVNLFFLVKTTSESKLANYHRSELGRWAKIVRVLGAIVD